MLDNRGGLRRPKVLVVLSMAIFLTFIILIYFGTCSTVSGAGISSSKPIILDWYGDEGSVYLHWSYEPPEGMSIDGFIIQYSEDGGFSTYTNISVDADITGWSIEGLDDGTSYYFRIVAFDGDSYSQWSNYQLAEAGIWEEGLGVPWYWLSTFILVLAVCVGLVIFVIYKVIKLRRI